MKTILGIVFFLGMASIADGQTLSTLPNSDALVLQNITAYGTVLNSVLLVGHFTEADRSLDDIITMDAFGNIVCLANGGGTFSQPIISSPGITLPLTAVQVVNFGTLSNPLPDSIFIANAGNVYLLTMQNCSVISTQLLMTDQVLGLYEISTVTPPVAIPGVVSISNVIPGLLSPDDSLIFATPSLLYSYDVITSAVAIVIPPIPPPPPPPLPPYGTDPIGAEYVQAGKFFNQSFILSRIPPNSPDANSNASFASILGGNLILPNPLPFNDLSGPSTLNFIPTAAGLAAASWNNCPICTEAEISLDKIALNGQQEITVSNITSFDIPGEPVGAVWGNFLGNNYDFAVATNSLTGSNVFVSAYVPGSTPQWTAYSLTLDAGGVVSAINHGMFVTETEDDIIVQTSNGLGIFASVDITEQPPTLYTLQTLISGPGSVAQNPVGALFAAGSTISLTALPTGLASFSGWAGGCLGASQTCSFPMPALNLTLTATFAAPITTPPAASIVVTPNSQSGVAGTAFVYTLAWTGIGNATLTASCQIPKGACSVAGNTLTVTTTASGAGAGQRIAPLGVGVILFFVWLCCPRRQRKLALAVTALALCGACGGGSAGPVQPQPINAAGTPAGNYSIEVSAAGVASTTVSLTIE